MKSDNTPVCWGRSIDGEVLPGIAVGAVTQISAGGYHTCAIRLADSKPACWGANVDYAGIGITGQSTPPNITVKKIATGGMHTCAIKTDNSVACWGSNLGFEVPPVPPSTTPTRPYTWQSVPPAISALQITASERHSCAIKTDNTAVCWGDNAWGQSAVPVGLGPVTAISAGAYHTCAIRSADSKVVCWGYNGTGGNDVPASLGAASKVSAGEVHACAIKASDSKVVCWGANSYGQSSVPSDLGTVAQLSAGFFHTCAVRTAGTVACWGLADDGRTGGAPKITSPSPTGTFAGSMSTTFTGVAGSSLPVRFYVSAGSLPSGVTLNSTTGVMAGSAAVDGAYAASVTATNDIFGPDSTQAFTLTFDRTPPAAPTLLATSPKSPSNSIEPRVSGAAEAGSTVKIYGSSTCAGAPLASGTAATFAAPGFRVSVLPASTTGIHAVAIDAAGNASVCSDGLDYTQVDAGPTGETGATGEPEQPTPPVQKPPIKEIAKEINPVLQELSAPRCATTVAGGPAAAVAFKTTRTVRVKVSVRRRVSPMLAVPSHCPRVIGAPAKSTKFKTVKKRTTGMLKPGHYRINLTRELRGLAPGFYGIVLAPTPSESKTAERDELYLWKLR